MAEVYGGKGIDMYLVEKAISPEQEYIKIPAQNVKGGDRGDIFPLNLWLDTMHNDSGSISKPASNIGA